ncbi:hypothetical protein AB1J99_31570 [Bacillus bombysepticus]
MKNPLIEEARNLSKSKYRIQDKKLLLFGIQQIEWALQSNLKVPHIFLSDKEDVNAYIHLNIPIFQLSEGLMKKLLILIILFHVLVLLIIILMRKKMSLQLFLMVYKTMVILVLLLELEMLMALKII